MARDWRDDRIEQLERENAELRCRIGRVEQLEREDAQLRKRVGELEHVVRELKELLGRSSQNSSKPPSLDDRKRKKKKLKSGRRPGGQPGHPKHDRPLVPPEQVDKFVDVRPPCCEHCNGPLDHKHEPERYQVFEIPKSKPHVTEFRLGHGWCARCGVWTFARLPRGVASVFGATVLAVLGVLMGRCRLSKRATQEAMHSLFGLTMSLGAVVDCQNRLSTALAAPVAEACEYVQQ